MKRGLCTSCFLLLFSCTFAQTSDGEITRKSKYSNKSQNGIARNIDGVILGKTTKQEIIYRLHNKKISYNIDTSREVPVINCEGNILFGGIEWFYVSFFLYNNVVFRIDYSKGAKTGTTKASIDLEYSRLKDQLLRKYGHLDRENDNKPDYYYFVIREKSTSLSLFKGYYEGNFLMSLTYTDAETMRKIVRKEK